MSLKNGNIGWVLNSIERYVNKYGRTGIVGHDCKFSIYIGK